MQNRTKHLIGNFSKCAGLAALTAVVLGPAAAHADNQMNAGAMCVSTGSIRPDYTTSAQAMNPSSTDSMTLVCPIVRGAFGSTGGMSGKVFVIDGSSTQDVCCSVRSRNAGSTSFVATADDCSSGVASYVSLDFSLSSNIGTWDYRFVRCTVPPTDSGNESGISGFRGIEN